MVLNELKLFQFRCYSGVCLRPHPKFNSFIGQNGQGKTSLLEAIGLLGTLQSFRHAKTEELLMFNCNEAHISGKVSNEDLNFNLEVKIYPHRKRATLNQKFCRFLQEYISKVAVVSFSPSDLEIIRGEPNLRRSWIDRVSQIYFCEHVDSLSRYKKILDQRNMLLRLIAEGRLDSLPKDFEIWTEELIKEGSKIFLNRLLVASQSIEEVNAFYTAIAGLDVYEKNQELYYITIEYLSTIFRKVPCRQASSFSLELIENTFRDRLKESFLKERALGTTAVGPHRDDLEILLKGKPIKAYGSQGEVRSLVLAMRLAEVELFKLVQGVDPLLLIDDFSSELDSSRQKYLLGFLFKTDSQVFLSSTEKMNYGCSFKVENGRILANDHEYISN